MTWLPFLLATSAPLSAPIDPNLHIWSASPATKFFESSVLGNGRLGAMIFGGVGKERVVLNESTMWSGSPQDADREDAHQYLPEIRRLLLKGDNAAAEELLYRHFVCKGGGSASPAYGCYQTFGDLVIDGKEGTATDYRRVLDLDRAVATVEYRVGDTHFSRSAFTSAPANVLVYRYRADKKGQITFDAKLARPERATTAVDGGDFLIQGEMNSGNPAISGVRFNGRLRVVTKGGKVVTDGNGVHVQGADEATLIFSAATSMFDPNFAASSKGRVEAAAKAGYDRLERESVKDHQRFFRRVRLDLPLGPKADRPTLDRLLAMAKGEDDPGIATLYFNFGRYLMIGSSRPDSPLPANLQGLWAEELSTPWTGDFHLDVNVEMNYWPAETTNLADCHRPLLDFIQRLVPNGENTAKAYYAADGWVSHAITNPWLFTSPGESASWGSVCTTGAWLCEDLWNHYAFTLDKEYLRKAYPTLKGSAQFFLDMLIEEPKRGWLVTAPSNSPENSYVDPKTGRHLSNCMGPTSDMAILRELFGNVIAASEVLDIDPEFREKLKATRKRLAPYQVGKHGQVQEWLEDYEETDPRHRHISPLYGLYPYDEISPDRTPELARAARVTLERRGDDGTGWGIAYKACDWARLHDGERTWKMLKTLFRPVTTSETKYSEGGGVYANLFCAHPPFQIDGNFGGTAAIAEMLLQGTESEIRLLPSLPKAWHSGSVKGLRAKGNRTVDIEWKDGKVTKYKVTGPGSKTVKVRLPGS